MESFFLRAHDRNTDGTKNTIKCDFELISPLKDNPPPDPKENPLWIIHKLYTPPPVTHPTVTGMGHADPRAQNLHLNFILDSILTDIDQ